MSERKLAPEIQELIERAIDDVVEQYSNNNKIIFESEAARAREHFGDVTERNRAWRISRQCMVPACSQASIKRSHAVPRSMSLLTISEGGHLVTPEFDQRVGALGVKRVGHAVASTFPGFCATHEQLFQTFESGGVIAVKADLLLQAYRSACRELYRAQFIVKSHDSLVSRYCEQRDAGLLRLVKERLRHSGRFELASIGPLTYSGDPLVEQGQRRVASTRKLVEHLQNRVVPALEKTVFQEDESDICVHAIDIDVEIPVALSGCGYFSMSIGNDMRDASVIIGVIPSPGRSVVLMVGTAADRVLMERYWSMWAVNALTLLSMVESWMINGSDQWYLKPSVWTALPEHRKGALLRAIIECKQNIGHESDLSIFDELRRRLLTMLAKADHGADRATYERFVANQMAKMA